MMDFQRLVDSAAATIPAAPDNLHGVRRRARALLVRRLTLSLTALGVVVAAMVQAWPAREPVARPPEPATSTQPRVVSSIQRMTVAGLILEQQARADFADVDPNALLEIGPDRTLATHPLRQGIQIEDVFLPGHSDGAACAKADQFAVRYDASGNETARRRLPKACDLFQLVGHTGDDVYLQQATAVSWFSLATGQHTELFTTQRKVAAGFAGSTIAVIELNGEQSLCTDVGWTIRTYDTATARQRAQPYHPATPCGAQWSLAPSPDGTRVAVVRDDLVRVKAIVVDMATGEALAHEFGPSRQNYVVGVVWADNATAWAASVPLPATGPLLQNVVRISVLSP